MYLAVQGESLPQFRFVDVAAQSGLTESNVYGAKVRKDYILEATGNGAAIFDYDNDGANDIFIANGVRFGPAATPTLSHLYRNDGKGHFSDVAAHAGLTRSGWAQGACVGDFDNDGNTDLFVTYYGNNTLYRNIGNGGFSDVTGKANLPVTGTRWGAGCAFLDYNRDGLLDIFVANYVDLNLANTPKPGASGGCIWKGLAVSCGPLGLPTAHNVLYRNNGDGTFTDVSESAGILRPGGRYGLGVSVADFDNDGWPDIYVACDQTPSLLYRNNHDGTFTEQGDRSGVAYNADGHLQSGMGAAVADFDGNGFLDIAKTNFSGDWPSLYRNEDGVFFEDVAGRSGLGANHLLGWGTAFLDIDEDGWPDLLIANGHVYPQVDGSAVGETYNQRSLVYRNLGNGMFSDITASAGPAFETKRVARGMATGDLDGDGRPEIVIVNMNQPPAILKNLGLRNKAMAFSLTGVRSNRSAIGARITVQTGERRQIAEVTSGGSYYSQNSMTLYFGLGNVGRADKVEIKWPSGEMQVWTNVAANQTMRVTEGNATATFAAWIPIVSGEVRK
jgi:hypothetical protein